MEWLTKVLALVIESMLTIGLKEFQLSVGNVDFFQSLIEDACLDEEAELRVRELINNRNYFGVEEFQMCIRDRMNGIWKKGLP